MTNYGVITIYIIRVIVLPQINFFKQYCTNCKEILNYHFISCKLITWRICNR